MPLQRAPDVTDLRRRLTAQVVKRLANGDTVLVTGGPKMGKTYLVERVRQALPTVAGYDDCDPDQAQALLESGTPSLATLNIRHYELGAAPQQP